MEITRSYEIIFPLSTFEWNFEDFPFCHLEVYPLCHSWKSLYRLLIFNQFFSYPVIGLWKVGVWRLFYVATVSNAKIVSFLMEAKDRAVFFMAKNQIFCFIWDKLFIHIKGKDEGTAFGIGHPFSLWGPGVMRIPSYRFAKLCAHKDDRILDIVTDLMECFNAEIILWGFENSFHLHWLIKELLQQFHLFLKEGLFGFDSWFIFLKSGLLCWNIAVRKIGVGQNGGGWSWEERTFFGLHLLFILEVFKNWVSQLNDICQYLLKCFLVLWQYRFGMLVRHFNFKKFDSVVKTKSLLSLKTFAIVLLVYLPDNLNVFELQVPEFMPLNKRSSCFFKLIEEIVFQVTNWEKILSVAQSWQKELR